MRRGRPGRRATGWWVGRRPWGLLAWKTAVAAVIVALALTPFWNWLRPPAPTPRQPPPRRTEPTVLLLMGIERNEPEDLGRCDTVMLVTLDGGGQPMGFLNVRRDSLVKIAGHGWDKINHSYGFGGPSLARDTVSWLVGRPVDHYVAASFEGFRSLVDAAGGIEVDIPQRMYYHDPEADLLIDLGPGRVHLDGGQTLSYCRFRSDEESDWGRNRRQQEVMRQLARKMLQPRMIARLPEFLRLALDSLETDLTLRQALSLATRVWRVLQTQDVEMYSMKGQTARLGPEGEWYVVNDLVELRAQLHRMLTGRDPPPELAEQARRDQAEIEAAANAMGWYRE